MSVQHQYLLGDPLSTNPGAFTHVYQLYVDAKMFAVRVFNNEFSQKEGFLATFITDCERLLAPTLSHVNIIQYVGKYSDENNRCGLIMEMMDTSLTSYLHGNEDTRLVPFQIQIGLSHDIAQALAYLHQNGIIHQNLTAKNVFLVQDSHTNLPLAKVGNFGMINFLQKAQLCAQECFMKFDILSFGALVTEIMSKQQVHALETEKIDSILRHLDNPLVSIVQSCCFQVDCPTAEILTMSLRIAKQTNAYVCRQLKQEVILQQKLESTDAELQRSCDAVTDCTRNIIYLRQGKKNKLFVLNLNSNAWESRPDCTLLQCALVFFEGNLFAIGGAETDDSPRSGDVYKLVGNAPFQKWENINTPLITDRGRSTALACKLSSNNGKCIVVAGGENLRPVDGIIQSLSSVEIWTGEGWHSACELPGTLCCASGTIVKENIFLLGGWRKRGEELTEVYTCHLSNLIGKLNTPSAQVWSKLSKCPIGSTTCLTLRDKLLIVGGNSSKGDTAIREYNDCTKTWDIIGQLPEPRYLCYAQALCNCRFLVIGGCKSDSKANGDTYIFELK